MLHRGTKNPSLDQTLSLEGSPRVACGPGSASTLRHKPRRSARAGGAARTCDGHVADALLVHGGHQDHGLRRHHHGSRQRLQHTEDDHRVTEEHGTHRHLRSQPRPRGVPTLLQARLRSRGRWDTRFREAPVALLTASKVPAAQLRGRGSVFT